MTLALIQKMTRGEEVEFRHEIDVDLIIGQTTSKRP